jgi:hypothetical protein
MASAPVIKSISPDTLTAGDRITSDNELTVAGTAGANSTINVFDGTTLLGTTTANSSGAWSFATRPLSDGVHSFTATSADATGTSPASAALSATIVPNVNSFSGTSGSFVTVDGMRAGVQNANESWSLTSPDSHTLRFSLHSGDNWSTSGWNDLTQNRGAERSEIRMVPEYAQGTQINVDYQFTMQPGATNTASWLLLGQFHQDPADGPVPFAVEMVGERMRITVRYQEPGQSGTTTKAVYTDPNPIQRGHSYDMNIQVKFDNNGNGYLDVWRDGVQIVDYNGSIGYGSGQTYYWKEGIYRSPAAETMTVDYANLHITTGSAPVPTVPTTPTTPTNPTNPTNPVNLAPTVTQASALPGTGIEHVGDTITLTLGFSEAVTVTGTPTLSLNDGGQATYFGGSGSNTLTFKTTVAATDRDTSALAITGVNLAGGSIKDASGLPANLSGALKTFTGLQVDVDPITPTNPTSPTSPSSVRPVLTVADHTLTVNGRGGTADLGVKVSTTDPNDRVTVNIRGLASYETITDGLGHTFSGRDITLTKAQVDSGLTLHNYYRGWRDPVDTITLTATAKDPVTGAVTTSASQTMTLADAPRGASIPNTTAPHTATVTPQTPTVMAPSTSTPSPVNSTVTAPQPISVTNAPPGIAAATAPATTTAAASSTSPGSALLSRIGDFAAGGVATSTPQVINVGDLSPATSSPATSLANQSFALLNQYMAANTGRVDPGQIVAATTNGTTPGLESFLTRPPA